MLIVGRRGYQKEVGTSNLQQECPHCHNQVTYQALETGTKFSLFFIPLFPIQRKFSLNCPICQYGYHVEKNQLDEYLD